MKKPFLFLAFTVHFATTSAQNASNADVLVKLPSTKDSMVDTATPADAFPMALQDSLLKKPTNAKWKLVFSDEFNDNTIDARKWNVENTSRKRTDIMLLANEQQVEEKEGNIFIYYRKLMTEDNHLSGRQVQFQGEVCPNLWIHRNTHAHCKAQWLSNGILDDARRERNESPARSRWYGQ